VASQPLELLGPPAGEDVVGSVDQRLRELDRDEPGLFRQVERRALCGNATELDFGSPRALAAFGCGS